MIQYADLQPLLSEAPNDLSRRKAYNLVAKMEPFDRKALANEVLLMPESFLSQEWRDVLLFLLT